MATRSDAESRAWASVRSCRVRPARGRIPTRRGLIGSLRRECLDHVIVLSERHLRRVLTAYLTYYHGSRTHLSLKKDAPIPRRQQAITEGDVVAFSEVGGLHHRYERRPQPDVR